MTDLTKPVKRKTAATVFDQAKAKAIVVSLEPTRTGASIGLKIAGSRDTYRLSVNTVFNIAVRHHQDETERLARKINKNDGVPMRSARARARKEMAKELRSA